MDCERQDMMEGKGSKAMKLHERVTFYAENQETWMWDFSKSLTKMLSNGYKSSDLENGPKKFWTQNCEFFTY